MESKCPRPEVSETAQLVLGSAAMSNLVRTSYSSSVSLPDSHSSRMCGTMPEFGCSRVESKLSFEVEKSGSKTSHMIGRMQCRQARLTKHTEPLSALRLIERL